MVGHPIVDVDRDRVPARAPLECGFEQAHEVFGFLGEFDIAVAEQLEETRVFHGKAGEQAPEIVVQDFGGRDDARMSLRVAGQADEPGHVRGDHQQAGKAAVVALPGQLHHHRHRQIADEGEGVRRVD